MTKQIVARYSMLKVGAWVAAWALGAMSLYLEGVSHGWRLPEGREGFLLVCAVAGVVYLDIVSAALLICMVRTRGVAICKVGEEFFLYYPFSRKRIALTGTAISATEHEVGAYSFNATLLRFPTALSPQVTIYRAGQADLNFRTGLLREPANVIAERMSVLVQGRQR